MKKLLTIIAMFVTSVLYGQVQPSQLPEITSFNGGDVMIIQQTDGAVRKFDWSFLESQIVPDEFSLYFDSTTTLQRISDSINVAAPWDKTGNYIYPSTIGDSVGIGTTSPATALDVSGTITASGNVVADTAKMVMSYDSLYDVPQSRRIGVVDTITAGTYTSYDVSDVDVLWLNTTSGDIHLKGLSGGSQGKTVRLVGLGSNNIIFYENSANASFGNKLSIYDEVDHTVTTVNTELTYIGIIWIIGADLQ